MKSFEERFTTTDWAAILVEKERQREDDREELAAIRRSTRLNEPLGNADFVKSLESKHARRRLRRKPGRPARPRSIAA